MTNLWQVCAGLCWFVHVRTLRSFTEKTEAAAESVALGVLTPPHPAQMLLVSKPPAALHNLNQDGVFTSSFALPASSREGDEIKFQNKNK